MNQHDRSNLEFLLAADNSVIRDWASKMPADDIKYAQELLDSYALELREKSVALLTEARLAQMDNVYPEAIRVIDKFRLTR